MDRPSSLARPRILAAAILLLLVIGAVTASAAPPQAPDPAPQLAVQGTRLFLGQARFQNGGPPCGSCHRLSTLPFPNGGTVGPDLSSAYQLLGDDGTALALQTLFFPTMMPIYQNRPLTAAEQQALAVLLKQASPAGPAVPETLELAGIAGLGFLALLAVSGLASRGRGRTVRASLVRQATSGGARP